MQIRKKWLNQLKNCFNKRFWEYYSASFCWWISSSCENHCTLLYRQRSCWWCCGSLASRWLSLWCNSCTCISSTTSHPATWMHSPTWRLHSGKPLIFRFFFIGHCRNVTSASELWWSASWLKLFPKYWKRNRKKMNAEPQTCSAD